MNQKLKETLQYIADHDAATYYANSAITRHPYGEGHLVEFNGVWYFLDVEDHAEALPPFIRSAANAYVYLLALDEWYRAGVAAGRDDVLRHARRTLGGMEGGNPPTYTAAAIGGAAVLLAAIESRSE